MRKSPTLIMAACLAALGIQTRAAIYVESGGIVIVEAEKFDARTENADTHHWHLVPDEDGVDVFADAPGNAPFTDARGGKYMQVLPDANVNANTVAGVTNDPHLDFRVEINTPGKYQLYMRWAGFEGTADTMYASIVELQTPGAGPDWYRYVRNANGSGLFGAWAGTGAPSTDTANRVNGGGGEVPAVWNLTPGTYTIRLTMREDACAVDAIALQLSSLPAPADPGPPATTATTTTFLTILEHPKSVTNGLGQTATFTVNATGSSALSYQWQRAPAGSTNYTEVPLATNSSHTTPALAVPADQGARFRAKVSIPGRSIESLAGTVTIDVTPADLVSRGRQRDLRPCDRGLLGTRRGVIGHESGQLWDYAHEREPRAYHLRI